ncbi:MAG: hypothetical protein D6773_03675 [Alphaproteobacteria bacterium]|nr:MAG: hypothetical protein D6773_03675 [Alphaproteobacteria bacterium]
MSAASSDAGIAAASEFNEMTRLENEPPPGWRMEGGAMVREFRCPDERLSGRLIEAVSALRERRPVFRPTFRLQLIGLQSAFGCARASGGWSRWASFLPCRCSFRVDSSSSPPPRWVAAGGAYPVQATGNPLEIKTGETAAGATVATR